MYLKFWISFWNFCWNVWFIPEIFENNSWKFWVYSWFFLDFQLTYFEFLPEIFGLVHKSFEFCCEIIFGSRVVLVKIGSQVGRVKNEGRVKIGSWVGRVKYGSWVGRVKSLFRVKNGSSDGSVKNGSRDVRVKNRSWFGREKIGLHIGRVKLASCDLFTASQPSLFWEFLYTSDLKSEIFASLIK